MRLNLFVALLIIVTSIGCTAKPASDNTTEPDSAVPLHLIDYAHSSGGKFYHGTISDFDGTVKATWSIDGVASDVQMTERELFDLWQPLTTAQVFTESKISDGNVSLDPEKFHVITVVEEYNGGNFKQIHQVPNDDASPEFAAWLAQLRIPNN